MAYFQMAVLALVGLISFVIFFGFFIDLNKDATFHNKRQRQMRPKLEVIKNNRRTPVMKGRSRHVDDPRIARGPQKRK